MHAGVSDHAPRVKPVGRLIGSPLAMTRRPMWPSRLVTLSASGKCGFRGSMASLHDPRPTLRLAPRGTRRTAWGRCDSLGLHRKGLSPPTPCRSPDALPARLLNDSSAAGQIVMPTEVGIHDFADASRKVVDGGPSPAMTVWSGPMGDSFRRLV
jgi:hypothetical protein